MWGFAKNLVKSAEGYINHANEAYEHDQSSNEPNYGFRIIHIDQHSPASEAGLESLFDFIIGLNGHELDFNSVPYQPPADIQTPRTSQARSRSSSSAIEFAGGSAGAEPATQVPIDAFLEEINNCKGRSINLEVWTMKGRMRRTVTLPVAESGDDSGSSNTSVGLGMTLQWTPLSVGDNIWHVLNVSANSPAEQAGLISHSDYIVGAENGLLEAGGESLLGRIVNRMITSYYNDPPQPREGPPPELELYVYNLDYDTVRPVRIRPNDNWGGMGLLGCGVGYGLLHRIPSVGKHYQNEHHHQQQQSGGRYRSSSIYKPSAPGATLFEAATEDEEEDTSNFITPALVGAGATHPPPPPKAAGAKKPAHHSNEPLSSDMQDYFAEETQKSKEQDHIQAHDSSAASAVPPPPPPPPKAKKSDDQ